MCTLPFSGVYFKAFEMMFFRIESIFFFVDPYIQVTEIAFASEVDVFHGSVWTERIEGFRQVSIQFIFRNIKFRRVYVCPFKVDKVGGEAQQCIHVS